MSSAEQFIVQALLGQLQKMVLGSLSGKTA